jgi:hypothetical protein
MRKMVRDADVLKRYLEIGNQGRLEVRRNCVLVDNADPVRIGHHIIVP